VHAASAPVSTYLTMTGRERTLAASAFLAALVNLGLNILLIPAWGMMGAAIATAAAVIGWRLLLLLWVVLQINKVPPTPAAGKAEGR
jgi:O-antigen/teichoic acid export membrane protein